MTGGDVTQAIIKAGIQNVGSLFKDSAEQDFKNLDDKLERGKTLTVEENDRLYNFYSNFNKPPDSDQPKVITDLDKEPITKSAEILAQEEAGTRAIRDSTIFADSSGVTGTQTDASPITSGLSVFGSGEPEAPKGEKVTDFSDLVLPPLTEEKVTDFSDLVLPPLTEEKVTDFSDLVLPPLTEEKVTDFSDLVERPASDELVSTDIPANVGDIAASLTIPEAAPKSPLETMSPPVELPAVVPEAPVATDLLTTGIAPEAPVGGLNAVAPTTPEEKMANSMGLELTDITKPLVATAGSLLKRARSQPKRPAPRAPVSRPTGALQLVKSPSKIAPPAKMDVSKLIPIRKAVPIAPPKTLASNAKLTPITNIATLTSLLKKA